MQSPLIWGGNVYLLEHALTLGDLSNNVLVEDGLNQDLDSAVLALDAEFLRLDVDINGVNIIDTALLIALRQDPVTELVVHGVAALLIIVLEAELLLELARKLSLASLDSLLADIYSPVILVGRPDLGSLRLELLELIVTSRITVLVVGLVGGAILGGIFAAVVASVLAAVLLLGLAGSLALRLILLALLRLVLQDKAAELEAEINIGALTASLAVENNVAILDDVLGLGVLALLAENEFVDEAVEVLLELGSVVGAVDDPTVVLGVDVGLSTELEPEVLDDVGSRASERVGDAGKIDDNGLDTVTLALNLGLQTLHLVAIELVADIATNVDERHDCGV